MILLNVFVVKLYHTIHNKFTVRI